MCRRQGYDARHMREASFAGFQLNYLPVSNSVLPTQEDLLDDLAMHRLDAIMGGFSVGCQLPLHRMVRILILVLGLLLGRSACAQGGPPYYTNDPGTPGPRNWEINLGYMPFLYSTQSVAHTPDVDINFGIGDRIQLTYENAWLRVHDLPVDAKFGLGQSNSESNGGSTMPASPVGRSRPFRRGSSTIPTIRSAAESHLRATPSCYLSSFPTNSVRSTSTSKSAITSPTTDRAAG